MLSQALTNHKVTATTKSNGITNEPGSTSESISSDGSSKTNDKITNHLEDPTTSNDKQSLIDRNQPEENTEGSEQSTLGSNDGDIDEVIFKQRWGYDIEELYEICMKFYKNNESKAFHPTFDQRNRLNAFIIQAKHGKYEEKKMPEIGVLDLVGKNRRHQWSLLGSMSKLEAKHGFITTIDELCPLFKAYIEAIRLDRGDSYANSGKQDQVEKNNIRDSNNGDKNPQDAEHQAKVLFEQQNKAIYDALCRQTNVQFSKYAYNQYPNDQTKRDFLVEKLQLQYYNQYMQQVYQQQQQSAYNNNHHTPNDNTNNIIGDQYIHPSDRAISVSKTDNFNNHNQTQYQSIYETQRKYSSAYTDLSDSNQKLKNGQSPRQHSMKSAQQLQQQTNLQQTIQQNTLATNNNHNEQSTKNRFISGPETASCNSDHHRTSQDLARHLEDISLNPPPQQPVSSKLSESQIQHQQLQQQFGNVPYHHGEANNQTRELSPSLGIDVDPRAGRAPNDTIVSPGNNDIIGDNYCSDQDDEDNDGMDEEEDDEAWQINPSAAYNMGLTIATPSLWTRNTIDEFKESIRNEGRDGIFVVHYGESVTVRAPTHPDGKSIYWEFATDDFDIGFGVMFQYDKNPTQPQQQQQQQQQHLSSIQINSEKSNNNNSQIATTLFKDDNDTNTDEDDEDRDEEGEVESLPIGNKLYDIERGQSDPIGMGAQDKGALHSHRLDHHHHHHFKSIVVIPIYRRDSHEEVYAGRHDYPDQGVYLLKFDNTYSKLRSKTVYYRVCYYPHHVSPTTPAPAPALEPSVS